MTINAGVWIDHYKAVVILLTDEGQEVLQILSEDTHAVARFPGAIGIKNSSTPNHFVGENKRQAKATIHLYKYFDEVIECVRDAQAILILGPGQARGEFRRRIESQKLRGHIAELKTANNLPDQQIAEFVRQHFQ
jgi:stalled ribosome rescue protein Dom34